MTEKNIMFRDGIVLWQQSNGWYAERPFIDKTIVVKGATPFNAVYNLTHYLDALSAKRIVLIKEIDNKSDLNKKMNEFIDKADRIKEKYQVIYNKDTVK